MGQNGAVIKGVCQRDILKGRIFALKAIFNLGLSTAHSAAFDQYANEFNFLASLAAHPNVVEFYAQFVEPVPDSIIPQLPEFVREASTINPTTRRRRRRPLPNQWAVFQWLEQTLQDWARGEFAAGGDDMMEIPWPKVARIMRDVCRGLQHLHRNNLVCVSLGVSSTLLLTHSLSLSTTGTPRLKAGQCDDRL